MATHVFAAFVTALGTASNNRGENEGNISTLQKLVWEGQVHTTVSAEAIRFALRRRLEEGEPGGCNRVYDDNTRTNSWKDPGFARWAEKAKDQVFVDDDLLGFMAAEAAKEENVKGDAKVRRAVLEVARAVSLTPWAGDMAFNAASPGATPSAQKKGSNPVPYQAEVHATRYQYGIALTPGRLRVPSRASTALRHLCSLGEVAGNHGRFLYDFSPESAVFRIAQEAAPRILYAFRQVDDRTVAMPDLLRKVKAGDVKPSELIIGGAVVEGFDDDAKKALDGASLFKGVMAACDEACKRLAAGAKP